VGSHGLRHIDLRALPLQEAERELEQARRGLSALTGSAVNDLAYPYGLSDEIVREAARRSGHRMAFAAGNTPSTDRYALPRLALRGQEGRRAFTLKIDAELRHLFE